jgi:hypothetical protein
MDMKQFSNYIPILQAKEFSLSPSPEGTDANFRFTYNGHNDTHTVIQHVTSGDNYHVPLALVEFANPGGVLVLTRPTRIFRAAGVLSFV